MELVNRMSTQWFKWIHTKNLIYNTCWEDPRIDREAMRLSPFDQVLMITSAGCNALDYALDGPRKISAVDMNSRQTALLDLKIAAIKTLEYNDFFKLFGEGQHPFIEMLYKYELRKKLSVASREVWDQHWHYFNPNSKRQGLYFRGTSGLVAWLMSHYLKYRKLNHLVVDIFQAKSLSEQTEIFSQIESRLWSRRLELLLNSDLGMSLLGVPRAQRKYLEKQFHGKVSNFIRECLRVVFTQLPLHDNYFWWLYVKGHYTQERCPEYLKEENFYKLKNGLVDCIETHTGTLSAFMEQSNADYYSHYVLLDHMDWLAEHNPLELQREWSAISQTSLRDAKILFRSGAKNVNFLSEVEIERNQERQSVLNFLESDDTLAEALHSRDRVQTYGCFKITKWRTA